MVMCAEILAIGPFKRALTQFYEYSAARYAKTQEGVPIVRKLFGVVEGTNAGVEFAHALGISNPWDFNQHKIQTSEVDFDALRAVLSGLGGWEEEYSRDLEALRAFVGEGYDLYFLPNA